MATDFGKDVFCLDTVRTGILVEGVELVAQACYRRLITPPGMLRGGKEEELYGFDIVGEVGKLASASHELALPGRIRAQLIRDERILDVRIGIVKTKTGPAVEYEITINATTAAGPFQLVLAVSAVSADIVGLTFQEAS